MLRRHRAAGGLKEQARLHKEREPGGVEPGFVQGMSKSDGWIGISIVVDRFWIDFFAPAVGDFYRLRLI
jgi:hypothetical protein